MTELMVACLSAQFTDGDIAANGMASHIPVCAIQLARLTHAPGLNWLAGSAGLNPSVQPLTVSTFEPALWHDALMYLTQADFWNYAASPRVLLKFCVGAAQVDQFGNMNNTVIGDYFHPRVRLPGTAGLADISGMPNHLIYWIDRHSPRRLVERVDFRSAIGFGDGYGERQRLGLLGGPALVITDLCVFDFAPGSQRMRVVSLHPGVTIDQVLQATGFQPETAPEISVTPAPTKEQIHLLRTIIDPKGLRYSRGTHPPWPPVTTQT